MTDQELERASLRDLRLMIAGILLVSFFFGFVGFAGGDVMLTIQEKLQQWGYWHRNLSSPIPAYQSIAGIIHRMNTECQDRRPVCLLDESVIGAIERAAATLKIRDRVRFDLLVMAYIYGLSQAAMAARLRVSRATVEKNLAAAEAWVDSRTFVE